MSWKQISSLPNELLMEASTREAPDLAALEELAVAQADASVGPAGCTDENVEMELYTDEKGTYWAVVSWDVVCSEGASHRVEVMFRHKKPFITMPVIASVTVGALIFGTALMVGKRAKG